MNYFTAASKLWEFLCLSDTVLQKADAIIGFGGPDPLVASRAAELYRQGYAPLIIFSGGQGRGTEGVWQKPEAVLYKEIAVKEGVPADRIYAEDASTNTGENIIFTRKLIAANNLDIKSIIAIHLPNMERRLYAAIRKQWPEIGVQIAPSQLTLKDYIHKMTETGLAEEDVICRIAGDFQRIDLYVAKGFQIEQPISDELRAAYDFLVASGYDKQIVR
jgi:uncharacterized SAM-binding protein YcdF (DUF218 family)